MQVFIGTYTGAKSRGIYRCEFSAKSGELTSPVLAAEADSPSFLAVHPSRPWLYCVEESGKGLVTAFQYDGGTAALTRLNQQSANGSAPCYVALGHGGHCVLVANYGNGTVASFPLQLDGRLGRPASVLQHHGSSVDPKRQSGPHAHFIAPAPKGSFVLACDLGLDKVLAYELTPSDCVLHDTGGSGLVPPGSGARHLSFHPNGRWLYVINEMGSSLTVFTYDPKTAGLNAIQTVSTLPKDWHGNSSGAEVVVHPNAKFVYASNRGHDSIAVFRLDGKTGQLTPVQHCSSGGKTPRHFAIDPSGRWLLSENQDSDNIVTLKINRRTGELSPTGKSVQVGSPVCLVFAPSAW